MLCKSCGKQLLENSAICPYCGATQDAVTDEATMQSNEPIIIYPNPPLPPTNNSETGLAPPPPPSLYGYGQFSPDPRMFPPAQPPTQPRKRRPTWKIITLISVIAVVLLASCGGGLYVVASMARNDIAKYYNNAAATRLALYATPTNDTSNLDTPTDTPTDSTPEVVGTPDPSLKYPPAGAQVALDDPLQDNSKGKGWYESNKDYAHCQFKSDGYHLTLPTNSTDKTDDCAEANTTYSNFVFQTDMTVLKGDRAGLLFRQDTQGQAYFFGIDTNKEFGLYLYSLDSTNQLTAKTLTTGQTAAANSGYSQPNTIAVMANGSTIDVFVNQAHIIHINDHQYTSGRIGMEAYEYDTSGSIETDVAFTNAKVWTW